MSRKKSFIIMGIIVLVALLFYITKEALFVEEKIVKDLEKNNDIDIKTTSQEKDFNKKFTINQLTSAVLENDISLVNQIIESGSIDINKKNTQGQYPIEMVLVMNNCDMAEILLKAGADPYVITSSGKSVHDIVMEGESQYLKEIFRKYSK